MKSRSYLAPLSFVSLLVVLDQVTKYIIDTRFQIGEAASVIPGFFSIVYVKNKGAAFGFLSGVDSQWVSRGFMIASIIAIGVIGWLYRSMREEDTFGKVALVLIGSGAIGNLIDRFRSGMVTDFLLFYIGQYQWPAFNVADSCITIGVMLMAVAILTGHETERAG